ncbi:PAS domain-containing protein [Streptomyces sp. NPDC001978]|uniref:PAS domain-containing protein n=1 Tax=Streptomyces sp. NPDC001978 TaxID=3364627 RepID=UPI00369321B4
MEHVAAAAVIDALGTVTAWSDGARQLTGHRAEEIVGRPAAGLLAAEPSPEALDARTGVVALRHRDGHRVDLALTACPVLGPDGRPTGYVITADRPPAPGPTRAEQAFQQASMLMSVFDTRQRYLRLNDMACRVMGVREDEVVGRACMDSVEDNEHSRGFLNRLRQVVETGRSLRYENFTGAPALNGERAWNMEMWPLTYPAGELTAVALAAFDSTEQYWARRRMALLNEAAKAIGTTLDVVRTAEELVEIIVPGFADFASVDLLDWVLGADESPATAPEGDVVLRRVAHGSVTEGVPEAAVALGGLDVYPGYSPTRLPLGL